MSKPGTIHVLEKLGTLCLKVLERVGMPTTAEGLRTEIERFHVGDPASVLLNLQPPGHRPRPHCSARKRGDGET